jgi:hypothetical protein
MGGVDQTPGGAPDRLGQIAIPDLHPSRKV